MNNSPRKLINIYLIRFAVRICSQRTPNSEEVFYGVKSKENNQKSKDKTTDNAWNFIQHININLKHFVTFLLLTSKITIKEKLGVGKSKACLHRFY